MSERTEISKDTRDSALWLSVVAWGLFGLMAVDIGNVIRERIGALSPGGDGWLYIGNQFGLGLVEAMPSIFLLFALLDFAHLFRRCSEGQIFTERNVKTLRGGGDSLLLAAAASALVTPTLVEWISGNPGGLHLQANDLTLGVGAMGLAIRGIAHIFREGVLIKKENDEFV